MEITHRYEVLEIDYSNEKSCEGQCGGTGWLPVHRDDDKHKEAWIKAHNEAHSICGILKTAVDLLLLGKILWSIAHLFTGWKCDGWHFIKCPKCNDTGRK